MKVNDAISNYKKALRQLKDAVAIASSELEIDGVIQRFEFTFELAWKALKAYLEDEGIICNSPKRCLKEAFNFGLIEDEDIWLSMLGDRNLSVHLYSLELSRSIFNRIKEQYVSAFEKLAKGLTNSSVSS